MGMDVLYAVDEVSTRRIQNANRALLRNQCEPIAFMAAFVLIMGTTIFAVPQLATAGLLPFLFVCWAAYCYQLSLSRLPVFLRLLHQRLDYAGATATRKRYSDGYNAWSSMLRSIACAMLALSNWQSSVEWILFLLAEISLLMAYFDFIERQEDQSGKKRRLTVGQTVSDMLGRLTVRLKPAN